MITKLKIIIAAFMTLAFAVSASAVCYSWFVHYEKSDYLSGHLGQIKISASGEALGRIPSARDTAPPLAGAGSTARMAFIIRNESSAETYVRSSCIPVYRDKDGNPMPKDVSQIHIAAAAADYAKAVIEAVSLPGGREKDFIVFREKNHYKVVLPGHDITGTLTVTYTGEDPDWLDGLTIELIPEAIQATKSAAGMAKEWGWDENSAVRQAAPVEKAEGGLRQ